MKKKNFLIFGIMLVLSLVRVQAVEAPPADLAGLSVPDNFLTNALEPILQKISFLAGGIFGIYVILAVLQIQRERKKIRLLQEIRNELDLLTHHFGVKHTHIKKGIFRRMLSVFSPEPDRKPKK